MNFTVLLVFLVFFLLLCQDNVKPSLVTGGTRALINAFPHMAALGYGSLTSPEFLCGGSLISKNFVLTAAHCIQSRNLGKVLFVRLGTTNITDINNDTLDIEISKVIVHPSYKPPSAYHDIALLQLKKSVEFSDNIFPAMLQHHFDLDVDQLITAGWGKDNFLGVRHGDLLSVVLDVVNFTTCKKQYKSESYKKKLPRGVMNKIQICAGGTTGKDSCQGDSGGPLEYVDKNKRHVVVGVTSVGKACGLSASAGIYTRVSAYFKWIEDKILL